jgi:hypothetical protein
MIMVPQVQVQVQVPRIPGSQDASAADSGVVAVAAHTPRWRCSLRACKPALHDDRHCKLRGGPCRSSSAILPFRVVQNALTVRSIALLAVGLLGALVDAAASLPALIDVGPQWAATLTKSLTIDLDTTDVEVYGRHKRGAAFDHQVLPGATSGRSCRRLRR